MLDTCSFPASRADARGDGDRRFDQMNPCVNEIVGGAPAESCCVFLRWRSVSSGVRGSWSV